MTRHVRRAATATAAAIATLAVLAVLGATVSCDREDGGAPATPDPLRAPIQGTASVPDGASDAFGPLPEKVMGFRVSRGAAAGYVDDQACKECHESIYASYRSVGMARSFYPPDPEEAVEALDQEFRHQPTGYRYVMSVRGGRYVLRRHCVDDQGRRFAEHEAEVAWIVGSGNHVRSYLSQNARGELFQLPVSWYTGIGWRMSPGFDRTGHQRFERMVDRGCMFCHNAYPEVPVGADLPHQSHRFPKTMPHGIGCQRCHGPGARHIEMAANPDATDAESRSRIANPAHFSKQQSEDVCMACHLQPESVRSKMMVRAFDRPMYSWQPGADLAEFVCYLDHGTPEEQRERFEINHHAYRLRQSKCYTVSGKLTCLTCHDPHRKVAAAEQATHYRNKCTQCHRVDDCESESPAHRDNPAGSDCVSCHMPAARPSDVIHVTVTDHFIRRKPPERELTAPRQEEIAARQPLSVSPYFPERNGEDPLYPVYEGFGRSYFPTPVALRVWRDAFLRTAPHPVAGYVNVARGLLESGDRESAIDILHTGAKRFPHDAAVHWTLGTALLDRNQVAAAVRELERALQIDSRDPGIQGTLADAYWRAGAHGDARTMYERSLQGRPESSRTWQSYGYALLQARDLIGALRALRESTARDPHDPHSYTIAASILQSQRRTAEQFRMLEQGASLLDAVKLELAAAKLLTPEAKFRDLAGGLELAAAVAEAQPQNGRAHLHVALAEALAPKPAGSAGRVQAALDRAKAAGADPASATLIAALPWLRQGDRQKADALLEPLRPELEQPNDERLFTQLVAYFRSAGYLR